MYSTFSEGVGGRVLVTYVGGLPRDKMKNVFISAGEVRATVYKALSSI